MSGLLAWIGSEPDADRNLDVVRRMAAAVCHVPTRQADVHAADSRAAHESMGVWMDRLMQPRVLRAVQELKPIAEEAGLTLPQFALAWVLREPNVASAIIGASRPAQIEESVKAVDVKLTAPELAQLRGEG